MLLLTIDEKASAQLEGVGYSRVQSYPRDVHAAVVRELMRSGEFITFMKTLKGLERSSELRQPIATHAAPAARQAAVKSLVPPAPHGVVLAKRWTQWTTFTR